METTITNTMATKYFNNAAIVAIEATELEGAVKWFGAKQVMQSPTIWIYEMEAEGEVTRFVKCKASNQWYKKA